MKLLEIYSYVRNTLPEINLKSIKLLLASSKKGKACFHQVFYEIPYKTTLDLVLFLAIPHETTTENQPPIAHQLAAEDIIGEYDAQEALQDIENSIKIDLEREEIQLKADLEQYELCLAVDVCIKL